MSNLCPMPNDEKHSNRVVVHHIITHSKATAFVRDIDTPSPPIKSFPIKSP